MPRSYYGLSQATEHRAAFLLLMHVDFSIAKSQPQLLAKVFRKLHKLFTLNWLDDCNSRRHTPMFQICSGKARSTKLEHMDN